MSDEMEPEQPHGGWPQAVEHIGVMVLLFAAFVVLVAGCVVARLGWPS